MNITSGKQMMMLLLKVGAMRVVLASLAAKADIPGEELHAMLTAAESDVIQGGMQDFDILPEMLPRDPDKVIDRKFIILAINPVNGKVYTEEDSLLLCAKDRAVPAALTTYHMACSAMGANKEHAHSIELLIRRVTAFQKTMGGGRVPDTVGDELPRCLEGKGL